MKNKLNYVWCIVIFTSLNICAQNNQSWAFVLGYSSFDNMNKDIMGNPYSNYNVLKYPNTFYAEKSLQEKVAIRLAGSFNKFEFNNSGNNNLLPPKNDLFISLEIDLKFNISKGIGKNRWLNPYFISGLGYSKIGLFGDAKFTGGLGTNIWIMKNMGLQLNSTFNHPFQLEKSNYLMHNFGLILKLNSNKSDNSISNNHNNEKNLTEEQKKSSNFTEVSNVEKLADKKAKLLAQKEALEKEIILLEDEEILVQKPELLAQKEALQKERISAEAKAEQLKKDEAAKAQLEAAKQAELLAQKERISAEAKAEQLKKEEAAKAQLEAAKQAELLAQKEALQKERILADAKAEQLKKLSDAKTKYKAAKVSEQIDQKESIEKEKQITAVKKETDLKQSKTNVTQVELSIPTTSRLLKVSNIYFESDQYKIRDDEKSKIHMIIYILNKNPFSRIMIEGHTAKEGDYDYNKNLGENRAKTVKQYLINKGVDPIRIDIRSMNSKNPMSTETTEASKSLNRRAKIILYNL